MMIERTDDIDACLAIRREVFIDEQGVPEAEAESIHDVSGALTYGWGCIPVEAVIGGTSFTTSLFPRDGGYLLPVKVAVQRAEGIGPGDTVHASIHLEPRV